MTRLPRILRGLILGSLFLGTLYAGTTSPDANPLAASGAMVQGVNVRFTVLTDRLIRMEWSADGSFEDRASLVFINRDLPVPDFSVDSAGNGLTISTSRLTLRYRNDGERFSDGNLTVSFTMDGASVEWHPGMTDTANLKGTTRTLDGMNGAADVTLDDGIISRSGWSVVDDTHRPIFDGSAENWVTSRPPGEAQDWYFFGYGHDYRSALYDFTRIAGKIPMPPRFAFGYWWSRYWTYSDTELRGLVADMERYHVPIDVLIIDMDWHETHGLSSRDLRRDPAGESVGWTGYTWNRRLFPEPERFLTWTEEKRLRTALNLHPASGIPPMEEKYGEFAARFGFDTTGTPYIPFAAEDRKWVRTWFDVILRPIERQGIDFWWLDWQAWLENTRVPGLSNTWWLNHVFFTEMERRGNKRPLLFHRWGGLGNHRYQIGFSGDSWSTWEALSYQPYFTATAGNVGYGYWSHDIGGHVGNDPDPELYLRWLQWGIFSPVVRTHSTKSASIERRIWKYPEHYETMRSALELRYVLNPYIYTAARSAYDSALSLCRPMYYSHPERDEAYHFTGQYMFGNDLLVAPVASKTSATTGLAEKDIWLPPGEWYEWPAGTLHQGDRVIRRSYTTGEIPVFARADAVIPMFPPMKRLDHAPDTLVLSVMPGTSGRGGGSLYEDDGTSDGYRSGQYAFTRIVKERIEGASPGTRVSVLPRRGAFPGMSSSRSYEVRFPSTLPPLRVSINGEPSPFSESPADRSWTYDGPRLTTSVHLPAFSCDSTVVVEVEWRGEEPGGGSLLDGKTGLLQRLPGIIEPVKNEVNLHDAIANAPATLLDAGSLGARIGYRPDLCAVYLSEFDSRLRDLVTDIVEYPAKNRDVMRRAVALLNADTLVTETPDILPGADASASPVTVSFGSVPGDAKLLYTLDGSEPGAAPDDDGRTMEYTGPFTLARSAVIRVRAFSSGKVGSFPSEARFHLDVGSSVIYASPVSPKYGGGGAAALIDGMFGAVEDFRSSWVGIQSEDLVATIELKEPREISTVGLRCLQNQGSWIFHPRRVRFETSADGINYTSFGDVVVGKDPDVPESRPGAKIFRSAGHARNVKFIRVRAENVGALPSWHRSAGQGAWLFADEAIIEVAD